MDRYSLVKFFSARRRAEAHSRLHQPITDRYLTTVLDEEVSHAGEHHIVRERLYELTAHSARVTLGGGAINLLFEFEEADYDFVGDLEVRMLRPQIHVTFPLGTTERAVVTGAPRAVFDFEVDSATDVPEPVRWAIKDFADELRNRVAEELSVIGRVRPRAHTRVYR